jgi:error-prone DNA polymerase
MSYIPLWNKTNFSFLEGASHPEELVEQAYAYGLPALAVTDRDGIYGVVAAHVKANALGLHLIIGAQMTLHDDSTVSLLATSREGYRNLCRLITTGRLRNPKGICSVSWDEIASHAGDLIALWGGDRGSIHALEPPEDIANLLREAFDDRLYAMISRHRRADEVHPETRLLERAERWKIPTVAAVEVLYHVRARRDLQDILTCIRHSTPITAAGRITKPNAEHDLKTPHEFFHLFADHPGAIARTREIADRCTFSLDELRYVYPAEHLPSGISEKDYLRRITYEGAHERFGETIEPRFVEQIEKELTLVTQLDYGGYFLTMWEIVRFCRSQGILCQGRGSAANSIICYCLGITAVDPRRVDLLFERFLSLERAEPPDIDLDIMHDRREEVIQWVYEKYGRHRAALAATVIRYRSRSAIREVGKALAIPETAIDRLAKVLHLYGGVEQDALEKAGFDPGNPAHHHLARLAEEIRDFPRHLSIHPGGFLLGHEPVHDLVPIENATMEDRTVIQWDKDSIEALGLFKVDLLGLGALSHLDYSFQLLRDHYDIHLSMDRIPDNDPDTYDMLCKGDTVGVFQVESRAQMAMLPRLRPRSYYDLVVEVSIVRPGPISGGMVHPYLKRRAGEEAVVYPHPSLEPVLKKTLGVPIFQEQVMQLAMVGADYTPGEADQLRRDMAAWRRHGQIERHREKLIARMIKKGIRQEFAEAVFEQIRGFGEYGFPESHAASFALIAYATAWMKCHHHDVFTCGLLNAWPMGFYSPATIMEDAKHHGIEMRPIDIRYSDWICTLEPVESPESGVKRSVGNRKPKTGNPHAVRVGFRYIKGMAHDRDWLPIAEERERKPFASLDDFARRTRLNEGILQRLAEAGALACFHDKRRDALWQVRGITKTRHEVLPLQAEENSPRFSRLKKGDDIAWDYDAMHHSTNGHPVEPLREELTRQGLPDAATVRAMKDGSTVRYAGLTICRQRPGTANGVVFMTLEDETGFVNVIIWDKIFRKHQLVAKTARFMGISGTLQAKDGVTHLIADELWIPDVSRNPRSAGSRDFH